MQEEITALPLSERLKKLAALPFSDQLSLLEEASEKEELLADLLLAATALKDHEPFAFLVGRLSRKNLWEEKASLRETLSALLPRLPDTGVQRVLRHLDRLSLPKELRQPVADVVSEVMPRLPLERIAAVCLMDRWLKNTDPEARERLCQDALSSCREALASGALASLPDTALLLCPGARLAELEKEAQKGPHREAWRTRLGRFAERVLDILEAMPKSLSQANAEELLSRRVYTDPGHFFVELLQNAEDALAREWRVEVTPSQVILWHDGVPFDAKDVVGVLSIGQTTKKKGQIGFFGVGFKAIYEICERPQVYSGPYSFEIADISIPRRLFGRPPGQPEDGTLLVLPLRDPHDEARAPALLYQRALSVPPETLLTLSSIRRLKMAFGDRSRTVRVEPGAEPGRVVLVHEETGAVTPYLVESDRFVLEGLSREASRVSETPVLVAVALDAEGVPTPVGEGVPTIFSYLPTGERSGLSFLVHAHFDLPIDRERLDLESPWNGWALSRAGLLLARIIERLTREQAEVPRDARKARRLDGILSILPLPREVRHPAYQAILRELTAAVSELSFLPGADGERLSPAKAALLEEADLVPVLAGVSLDEEGRKPLSFLGAREAEVALALGAARFGQQEVFAFLLRVFSRQPEGERAAEPWLGAHIGLLLDTLSRAALAPEELERLRSLPFVPDTGGRFYRPEKLWRADPALRALYGDARLFLQETLDLDPTPEQEHLWRKLSLARLSPEDLLRDLEDPDLARNIVARAGIERLLTFLAGLPSRLTRHVGLLPLFPDEAGSLRPLLGQKDEIVWLSPGGPLGEFLRAHKGPKPPLLPQALEESLRSFFQSLGAKALDLGEVLAAIRRGALVHSPGEVPHLHVIIEQLREDLTARLCEQLAQTPIFPDREGRLRPLVGEGRALLAADDDIIRLAPEAPWLSEEIAKLRYLGGLGLEAVGPAAVARALLEEEPGLFSFAGEEGLGRAYTYLIAHPEGLSPSLIERLLRAPLWRDEAGRRFPLFDLRRRPASPSLAALYQAWGAFPMIEEGPGSALELVQALRLEDKLLCPTYETLIDDLVAADLPKESGEGRAELAEGVRFLEELVLGDARPLLVAALNEAARLLPRGHLIRLLEAPIFRASDGACYGLSSWEEEFPAGCLRALGPARELLLLGAHPLLSEEDEEELSELLLALGISAATPRVVVRALESDGALMTEAARAVARRVLSLLADELARDFPARKEGKEPNRIEKLPLWPTRDGRLLPAVSVVRGNDLVRDLGADWEEMLFAPGVSLPLLAEEAEEEADVLRGVVRFSAPLDLILTRLAAEARPGQPLSSQPPFLKSIAQVARLLRLVMRQQGADALLSLPLAVDAAGCLCVGPRFSASTLALTLAKDLPFAGELADPEWAKEVSSFAEALAPRLPARRLLAALAETAREPTRVEDHPQLKDPARRSALYQWLLETSQEIEADEQAWGILGKACLIATEKGFLRAPRELLLEPDFPDLGIDWNAAQEVPGPLVAFLKKTYRLEEKQLSRLVNFLLDGHEEAASQKDGARSYELLRFLARVLRPKEESLEAEANRFRLYRRLKVETEEGEFIRPRKLLVPTRERWALIRSFAKEPPPCLSARYEDPAVKRLLCASGARADLLPEELEGFLQRREGLQEGLESALALARYIALLLAETPSLRQSLSLDRVAWIPNREGDLCAPSALYWPDPDVVEIVGDRPALYPHPELFHTVPEELSAKLPFRKVNQASFSDVLAQLEQAGVASNPVLRWLEAGLSERRLDLREVREALQEKRVFLDDDWNPRAPWELLRFPAPDLFGKRRGSWSAARDFPRLADALRIPNHIGARELGTYLQEIAGDLKAQGEEALLREEPSLLASLPKVLARLAEVWGRKSGAPPEPIAVLARDAAGRLTICLLPGEERLVLPEPESLLEAAEKSSRSLLFPVLLEEGRDETCAFLRRYGVNDLEALFSPPSRPAREERRSERPAPEGRTPPLEEKEKESEGLFSRMRRWLRGNDEEEPARERPRPEERRAPPPRPAREERARERSAPARPQRNRPPRDIDEPEPLRPDGTPPRDHGDWFRPRASIDAQVRANRGWLADRERPPAFGLAFAPGLLPLPYLYGPQLISDRFDPRGQRWLKSSVLAEWRQAEEDEGARVAFRGKIPAGEVLLPLPLFSRILEVQANPRGRLLETREGQPLLLASGETEIYYEVVLGKAPDFTRSEEEIDLPALRKKTVSDEELPEEVLDFLADLRRSGQAPLQRALAIRDFIRERYRYDPSYLEDPAVARWLRSVSQGRSNVHLAALHAGRDARFLGRGVCYELNVLACELLRRVGTPAAVATGWTFDRGSVTEPDHLWAMALLPSEQGPRWLPIDASSTREGRPLHAGSRQAGPWRVRPPARQKLPSTPSWDSQPAPRRWDAPRETLPTEDLLRVARYVEEITGERIGSERALRRRCRDILADPAQRARLLALLRGE